MKSRAETLMKQQNDILALQQVPVLRFFGSDRGDLIKAQRRCRGILQPSIVL